MKKTTIIMAVLMAMAITANAQWTQQTSGTTKNLWGISFINQNLGFVCGDTGTILKTTDGGVTWLPKNSGTTYQLSGLQFVDANIGYCSSFSDAGGILIKTSDGGTTWNDISLNVSGAHSGGGWFVSADTGFMALGNSSYANSKILRTVNGGVSWDTVYNGGSGWISFLHFPHRNNGYATVSGSNVLKTTDGGDSWTLLNNIGGNLWMSGVYFLDQDTGFVGGGDFNTGGGSIFKTNDGGSTWQTLNTLFYTSVMVFTTSQTCYAIGGDSTMNVKNIIKTTDAGVNWASDLTAAYNLNNIAFPTTNIGYAVGDGGKILKMGSGGVGVKENEMEKQLSIYPNPASDIITLNINNGNKKELILNIYNVIGDLIRSELLKQNPQKINIGDLNNGVYLIEIKSKEGSEKQKLIIQR